MSLTNELRPSRSYVIASRVIVADPAKGFTFDSLRDSASSAVRFSFATVVAMRSSSLAISSCFADAASRASAVTSSAARVVSTSATRASRCSMSFADRVILTLSIVV